MKKRILIVAPHGIGDAVMTCQAVRGLLQHSDCFFLVGDRATSNLIVHITGITSDKIFLLGNGHSRPLLQLGRLWVELFKKHFDGSICQYGVSPARYALLTFFLMVRVRLGWVGRLSLLNSLNFSTGGLHKVEATKMMVRAITDILKIHDSNAKSINTDIRVGLKDGIVLGISSFEGEKHKRWPLERFSQLCKLIYRDFPEVRLIIIGSAEERAYADNLIRIADVPSIQNACGLYSIEESCERIRRSLLVVANCNAISHIAGYFDVPTIGLYGPTNPSITGPISEEFIPIRTSSTCAPCYSPKFSGGCVNPTCMEKINPNSVYQAVFRILIANG